MDTAGGGELVWSTVAQTVAWTVQRRGGWRGTLARVAEVVAAVVNARTQGWELSPTDAKLPTDTGTVLNVDRPLVRGQASFLPRFVDDSGVPMEVYVDRATVSVQRGFETVEIIGPLAEFAVVGHRRLSGRWFPKGPTARWELVLASDHGDEHITVTGSWLTLAWLAYLGDWREPVSL
jgi:hypothetical protein